jgi:hypothetical protein
MIYELRVYKCIPGRLPALNNRFANITLKIWEKHGIKQAGFWTTLVGESNQELYYLLAWESLADREKKWNAFAADPEWHAKRAETEKDGAIIASVSNLILQPIIKTNAPFDPFKSFAPVSLVATAPMMKKMQQLLMLPMNLQSV